MAGERALPGLGLRAYWNTGSNNWELQHDPDTRMLSALCQCAVLSRVTNLPGAPADGDMYIVPVGQPNATKIAVRDNGAWVYYTPLEGWWVYDKGADIYVFWNGTAWGPVAFGISEAPINGQGYARMDGGWVAFTPGISDAASDGKRYERKNGAWIESISTYAGLTDVDLTGLANNYVMKWDSGTSKWKPAAAGGGGSLATLSDVDVTTAPPSANAPLIWSATSSKWVPKGTGNPYGAHRYWGFQPLTSDGTTFIIAEIELHETAGGGDLTVPGVTPSYDFNRYSSYSAANAIDDVGSSVFGSVSKTTTRLWYDLGTAKEISEVTMQADVGSFSSCPRSFNVIYSDDGTTWTTAWTVTTGTAWASAEKRTFLSPAVTDFQTIAQMHDVDFTTPPAAGDLLKFDGTKWKKFTPLIEIVTYAAGTVASSGVILSRIAAQPFRLPAGMATSKAVASTASTGTAVFNIKKNGTNVGTITFTASTNGVFAMASATSFAVGDVLTVVGPASADATLAGITASLLATLT